jgi:cyclomaltodextrinase / maltogenic alpha-amylase / neopullulanase
MHRSALVLLFTLLFGCARPLVGAGGAVDAAAWPPSDPVAEVDHDAKASLPPSVEVRQRPDGRWDARFAFAPESPAQSVSLAGSFNGWSRDATPLRRGSDGVWTATVVVASGTWDYKFVVDGTQWVPDRRNPESADDGHGGRNSRIRLGAFAALSDGRSQRAVGDGAIVGAALGHEPARPIYRQRDGSGALTLRYRTLADDVERVALIMRDAAPLPMTRVLAVGAFQYWEASVAFPTKATEYTFRVQDGALIVRDPEIYSLDGGDASPPSVRTPDWAKHAIWYQVFPERFRNGRADNDQDGVLPWTSDWYERTEGELAKSADFYDTVFERRYGGDIAGIREKLPYLRELGVTALYLTPVFQSPSLHRYDATSYIHIDEHLGTKGDYAPAEAKENLLDPATWTWTPSDREFLDFLREAKAMGFRVIIDGVFNHVGVLFPAYLDVLEKGKASRFADWFAVKSWDPVEIEGWAGFGAMPVFRKDEQGLASREVVEHIFAITRRWMDPNGDGDPSDGVDGWRLDVPNEVPLGFWREWRTLVKSINPDAYLVGEIWRRADEWVDGTVFDAVMNYPFADAAIAWVANREKRIGASELDRRLAELRLAYPPEATYVLQNLLDSHDTDRIASMVWNPDREYNAENRPQAGARSYRATRPPAWAYEKVRLLALLQMTYVGAPMVWYGDEVGMYGASDPTNRKPMLWKDLEPYAKPEENFVDTAQLDFYREAIGLRRAFPALRVGGIATLLTDDVQQVWVFERMIEGERLLVALNAGDDEATIRLPVEGQWVEVFATVGSPRLEIEGRSAGDRFPKVTIPAIGGRVWKAVGP